jgi:hypothetical protein
MRADDEFEQLPHGHWCNAIVSEETRHVRAVLCVCTYGYICMCVCMCIHVYVCMHACAYVCMCACKFTCTSLPF